MTWTLCSRHQLFYHKNCWMMPFLMLCHNPHPVLTSYPILLWRLEIMTYNSVVKIWLYIIVELFFIMMINIISFSESWSCLLLKVVILFLFDVFQLHKRLLSHFQGLLPSNLKASRLEALLAEVFSVLMPAVRWLHVAYAAGGTNYHTWFPCG